MAAQFQAVRQWANLPVPPLPLRLAAEVAALRPKLFAPFRVEDAHRRPLTVTNLVVRVETACVIDFLALFGSLNPVRRARVKFPQVIRRQGSTTSDRAETPVMYRSGKLMLCGTRSEISAIRALQLQRIDAHQANIPMGLVSWDVVNIVVKAVMPFDVDIKRADESRALPNSSLVESDFPGLVFKMRGVEVLAFGNGGCVFTGATGVVEMETVRVMTEEALRPFSIERKAPGAPREGSRAPSAMKGSRASSSSRQRKQPGSTAGKSKAADGAASKPRPRTASGRPSRRSRAVVRAQPVADEESRAPDRRRGVAFQINERTILRPGVN